jgi:hypothetical protein
VAEILYAPDRERVVTSNAWAFLHWLRTTRGVDLPNWAAMQRWSAGEPGTCADAVRAFARQQDAAPALSRPLAEALLFADLRPHDRVLVSGPVMPWLAAQANGTAIVSATGTDVLAEAADQAATVLVAPEQVLGKAAVRRPRRLDLAVLRIIVATGGPLSPEARRRIYTWVKADVMLLARTGDTLWGNPLEPVLARPPATPALLSGDKGNPPPMLRAPQSR